MTFLHLVEVLGSQKLKILALKNLPDVKGIQKPWHRTSFYKNTEDIN